MAEQHQEDQMKLTSIGLIASGLMLGFHRWGRPSDE